VNLFIGSNSDFKFGKTNVNVNMQTDYPWNGNVKFTIDLTKRTKFNLYLRMPGWANGEPAPGSLYKFAVNTTTRVIVKVNGKEIQYTNKNGYLVIAREWKKGDVVEYSMPM